MTVLLVCACFLILETSSAPLDDGLETTTENVMETKFEDPQTNQKNPVQEWFESLSKNMSTNTQNGLNTMKEWFTKLSNNQGGAGSNLPVMYAGSFQLIKMPMPQFSDVIKGMGDLATAAQTVNKLTGGGGLPIPGLQG